VEEVHRFVAIMVLLELINLQNNPSLRVLKNVFHYSFPQEMTLILEAGSVGMVCFLYYITPMHSLSKYFKFEDCVRFRDY
jgi:hypothetical protein